MSAAHLHCTKRSAVQVRRAGSCHPRWCFANPPAAQGTMCSTNAASARGGCRKNTGERARWRSSLEFQLLRFERNCGKDLPRDPLLRSYNKTYVLICQAVPRSTTGCIYLQYDQRSPRNRRAMARRNQCYPACVSVVKPAVDVRLGL